MAKFCAIRIPLLLSLFCGRNYHISQLPVTELRAPWAACGRVRHTSYALSTIRQLDFKRSRQRFTCLTMDTRSSWGVGKQTSGSSSRLRRIEAVAKPDLNSPEFPSTFTFSSNSSRARVKISCFLNYNYQLSKAASLVCATATTTTRQNKQSGYLEAVFMNMAH